MIHCCSLFDFLCEVKLTPCSTKKLTVPQLVKKFAHFMELVRSLACSQHPRHLYLSRAIFIQSTPYRLNINLNIILHLRLRLSSVLFPSSFPTETLHIYFFSPLRAVQHKQQSNKCSLRDLRCSGLSRNIDW